MLRFEDDPLRSTFLYEINTFFKYIYIYENRKKPKSTTCLTISEFVSLVSEKYD